MSENTARLNMIRHYVSLSQAGVKLQNDIVSELVQLIHELDESISDGNELPEDWKEY